MIARRSRPRGEDADGSGQPGDVAHPLPREYLTPSRLAHVSSGVGLERVGERGWHFFLRTFRLVFPERFEIMGLDRDVEKLVHEHNALFVPKA